MPAFNISNFIKELPKELPGQQQQQQHLQLHQHQHQHLPPSTGKSRPFAFHADLVSGSPQQLAPSLSKPPQSIHQQPAPLSEHFESSHMPQGFRPRDAAIIQEFDGGNAENHYPASIYEPMQFEEDRRGLRHQRAENEVEQHEREEEEENEEEEEEDNVAFQQWSQDRQIFSRDPAHIKRALSRPLQSPFKKPSLPSAPSHLMEDDEATAAQPFASRHRHIRVPFPSEMEMDQVVVNAVAIGSTVARVFPPASDSAMPIEPPSRSLGLNLSRSFRAGWGPNGMLYFPKAKYSYGSGVNAEVHQICSHHVHAAPSEQQPREFGDLLREHKHSKNVSARLNKYIEIGEKTMTLGHRRKLTGTMQLLRVLLDSKDPWESLSLWTRKAVEGKVKHAVSRSEADNRRPLDHLDRIFSLLSGNQVEEACAVAIENREFILGSLLSQIGQLTSLELDMRAYTEQMKGKSPEIFDTLDMKRQLMYSLLSGNVVEVVNWFELERSTHRSNWFPERLDWKRVFGMLLWYQTVNAEIFDHRSSYRSIENRVQYDEAVATMIHGFRSCGSVLLHLTPTTSIRIDIPMEIPNSATLAFIINTSLQKHSPDFCCSANSGYLQLSFPKNDVIPAIVRFECKDAEFETALDQLGVSQSWSTIEVKGDKIYFTASSVPICAVPHPWPEYLETAAAASGMCLPYHLLASYAPLRDAGYFQRNPRVQEAFEAYYRNWVKRDCVSVARTGEVDTLPVYQQQKHAEEPIVCPPEDIDYHLLQFFASHTRLSKDRVQASPEKKLAAALEPTTHTTDPFDYELSWHLGEVLFDIKTFQSTKFSEIAVNLGVNFASLLLMKRQFDAAIYVLTVLMKQTSKSPLEGRIKELWQNAIYHQVYAAPLTSLEVHIPEAWGLDTKEEQSQAEIFIWTARSWKTRDLGNVKAEFASCFRSSQWSRAHMLILKTLTEDDVMFDGAQPSNAMKNLLESLSGIKIKCSEYIADEWMCGGGAILQILTNLLVLKEKQKSQRVLDDDVVIRDSGANDGADAEVISGIFQGCQRLMDRENKHMYQVIKVGHPANAVRILVHHAIQTIQACSDVGVSEMHLLQSFHLSENDLLELLRNTANNVLFQFAKE